MDEGLEQLGIGGVPGPFSGVESQLFGDGAPVLGLFRRQIEVGEKLARECDGHGNGSSFFVSL